MISASIVLYNSDSAVIESALTAFFQSNIEIATFYLIDNSPKDALRFLSYHPKVEYIHNPSNPGFGAGHNIALQRAVDLGTSYHFVINPDVSFNASVIMEMVEFMEENSDVGMLMPKILNDDSTVQFLPKLLPSPLCLIKRIIFRRMGRFKSFVEKYEMREFSHNSIMNVPVLSGCFTLFRLSVFSTVGFYDDKFFMYFEDWDMSRRVHQQYRTIYYPHSSVIHGYESGAGKNYKLFFVFIQSAIHYFNKWGWIFDRGRNRINKSAIARVIQRRG